MYKSKSGFRRRRLGFDLGGEDGKGLPQLGRGLLQVAGVHELSPNGRTFPMVH